MRINQPAPQLRRPGTTGGRRVRQRRLRAPLCDAACQLLHAAEPQAQLLLLQNAAVRPRRCSCLLIREGAGGLCACLQLLCHIHLPCLHRLLCRRHCGVQTQQLRCLQVPAHHRQVGMGGRLPQLLLCCPPALLQLRPARLPHRAADVQRRRLRQCCLILLQRAAVGCLAQLFCCSCLPLLQAGLCSIRLCQQRKLPGLVASGTHLGRAPTGGKLLQAGGTALSPLLQALLRPGRICMQAIPPCLLQASCKGLCAEGQRFQGRPQGRCRLLVACCCPLLSRLQPVRGDAKGGRCSCRLSQLAECAALHSALHSLLCRRYPCCPLRCCRLHGWQQVAVLPSRSSCGLVLLSGTAGGSSVQGICGILGASLQR